MNPEELSWRTGSTVRPQHAGVWAGPHPARRHATSLLRWTILDSGAGVMIEPRPLSP
jgi:hypothetical protein